MEAKQLLEENPRALKIIEDWFAAQATSKTLIDINLWKPVIHAIIDRNPRALFDVMDSNGIIIDMSIISIKDMPVKFFYSILNHKTLSDSFPSRKEAERAAIEESIKLLNESKSISSEESVSSTV